MPRANADGLATLGGSKLDRKLHKGYPFLLHGDILLCSVQAVPYMYYHHFKLYIVCVNGGAPCKIPLNSVKNMCR